MTPPVYGRKKRQIQNKDVTNHNWESARDCRHILFLMILQSNANRPPALLTVAKSGKGHCLGLGVLADPQEELEA